MRSGQGDLVYLEAIKDPVFNYFAEVLKKTEFIGDQMKKVDLLHHNFGFACDPSQDVSLYQITNKPRCPQCHNIEYLDYGITNPPESIDIDIKPVTHKFWDSLGSETQKKIINAIIKNDVEELKLLSTFKHN